MPVFILLILLICIAFGFFCYWENNALTIDRYALNLSLRHPVKIVHLSDLHGKHFGKQNEKLIEEVKKLKPDLVVYTGDLIDGDGKNMPVGVALLQALSKDFPVYFVTGNNEQEGCFDEITKKLSKVGVHVLVNEIAHTMVGEQDVYLLGLNESFESHHGYGKCSTDPNHYADFSPLFYQLETQNGLKLVLSHFPENYKLIGPGSFFQYHFDVMFAGHAHGGQFILPFVGAVFAPGQGLFPAYTAGIYGGKGEPKLCVNRGLGKSSFPLRLFNRPQIIDITLL